MIRSRYDKSVSTRVNNSKSTSINLRSFTHKTFLSEKTYIKGVDTETTTHRSPLEISHWLHKVVVSSVRDAASSLFFSKPPLLWLMASSELDQSSRLDGIGNQILILNLNNLNREIG